MLCRSSLVVRHSLPRLPLLSRALSEPIAKSCFSSKSKSIGPFDSRSLVTSMTNWMSSAAPMPLFNTHELVEPKFLIIPPPFDPKDNKKTKEYVESEGIKRNSGSIVKSGKKVEMVEDKVVSESHDSFIQDCIKSDPLFNWRFEKKSNEFEKFWNGLSFRGQLAWIYTNEQDENNVLGRIIRGLAIKRLEGPESFNLALDAFEDAQIFIEEKKKINSLSEVDQRLEQIILKEIDEIKSYKE
jgi:hypothetical protein